MDVYLMASDLTRRPSADDEAKPLEVGPLSTSTKLRAPPNVNVAYSTPFNAIPLTLRYD